MTDYFTLAELRALPDLSDTTRYPDDKLTAARDWITAIVERVCGTSFVGKSKTVTLAYGRLIQDPYVLSLSSVLTSAGADVLANSTVTSTGRLVVSSLPPYSSTPEQLTVTYLSGYSSVPPADLKQVMLQAARYRVVSVDGKSGIPSRAVTITNELGNVTLATAGENRPTGIPDVDAVILGWAELVRVSGVA